MFKSKIIEYSEERLNGILSFLTGRSSLHKSYGALSLIWHEAQLRKTATLQREFQKTSHIEHIAERFKDRILSFANAHKGTSTIMAAYNTTKGYKAWAKAKKENDFSIFAPYLKEVVGRTKRLCTKTQEFRNKSTPYEARLDRLTPGLTLDYIETYKSQIMAHRERLADTTYEEDIKPKIETGMYAMPKQQQFQALKDLCAAYGFNEQNLTLIEGEDLHPLCFTRNKHSTITYKCHEDDFVQTALDVMHELGHAILRTKAQDKDRFTYLGLYDTFYNGPDEACALFFEQYVTRSPESAQFIHALFSKHGTAQISLEDVKTRLKYDSASLTRIDARPERSVLFHLMYYDIARKLIDHDLPIDELEQVWEEKMQEYHGKKTTQKSHESILQDPHWMSGEFGRFPAGYLVGTLMAAQLYKTMRRDINFKIKQLAQGDATHIVTWFQDKVCSQPRRSHFNKFMADATQAKLSAKAFIELATSNTIGMKPENDTNVIAL